MKQCFTVGAGAEVFYVAETCQFNRCANYCEEEGKKNQNKHQFCARCHGWCLFEVSLRSKIVRNFWILPPYTLCIAFDKFLGKASHIWFCALLGETQAHSCVDAICVLSLVTTRKLVVWVDFSFDGSEDVLAIGWTICARAVVSPLSYIPPINKCINYRSIIGYLHKKSIDCLVAR